MINNLFDSSKGGLTNQNDKQNIENFLNALSGPAREAFSNNDWTKNNTKADALKKLADEFKNNSSIADTINDLASNNSGTNDKVQTSDLDAFLASSGIGTTNPITDITSSKNTRDEVLSALGGTTGNSNPTKVEKDNAEKKSRDLVMNTTPSVTSADLKPLVDGLLGNANKNKLSVVPNNVIADLVVTETPSSSSTPNGTSRLKEYLNATDKNTAEADLKKYADKIVKDYNPSTESLADFIKRVTPVTTTYTVDMGYSATASGSNKTYTVTFNDNEMSKTHTAAEIWDEAKKNENNTAIPVRDGYTFVGWKVNGADVESSTKYASGTTITANWQQNASATGGTASDSDPRTLGVKNPDKQVHVGDTVYKATDGKGWVISGTPEANSTVLGYVYAVENDGTVKVASNTIYTGKKWARQGGAVYNSTGYQNYKPPVKLSVVLANVANGYDAWQRVTKWNENASFYNYEAIATALIDKIAQKPSGDPGAKDASVKNITDGTDLENRWYLPNAAELQKLAASGIKIGGNALSGNFWSCEVSETTETNAKYVAISGTSSTLHEADKQNTSIGAQVIAVAQFNYSTTKQ